MRTHNEWGLASSDDIEDELQGFGLAQAAPAPATSTTGILVGALGAGAVGGIFGYLVKGEKGAAIGAVGGAVVGGVAGSYLGKPAASTPGPSSPIPTKMPAGGYTLLGTNATLLPGETYLISAPTPTGQPVGLTTAAGQTALAAYAAAGYVVVGAWDVGQTPAGWPSGDPNATTGVHLALTNATGAAAHPGAGATVWTTGGAST